MMNFQNTDEQITHRVKSECQKTVQNMSFTEDSKKLVLSAISNTSYHKKIKNKINVFIEYEINIPVKAYLACALALCIMFCYIFFQNINISAEDINAAKIHYITNVSNSGDKAQRN